MSHFSSENYPFYSCEILQYIARTCLRNDLWHFNPDNLDQKREFTYMMMSLHTGSIMHIIFCFLSIEFIGILFKVLVTLKLKYTHLPDILVHTMLSFLVIEWVQLCFLFPRCYQLALESFVIYP